VQQSCSYIDVLLVTWLAKRDGDSRCWPCASWSVTEALYIQILYLPRIQNPLLVDEFIEPLAEQVIDKDSDIIGAVIAIHRHNGNKDKEEVEEELEELLLLLANIIKALIIL
jgi:hypothetical protein